MFAEIAAATTAAGWITSTTLAMTYRRRLHTDPLTGIGNRACLYRRARRHRRGLVALAMVDLDQFKAINDTHGHPFGNAVLQTVAARLNDHTRRGELVVRLHGDEFAIWLGRITTPGHADNRASEIAHALAEPVWIDGHRITALGSIGLAVAPATTPITDLLGAADQHMYQVKANRSLAVLPTTSRRTRDTHYPGGEAA